MDARCREHWWHCSAEHTIRKHCACSRDRLSQGQLQQHAQPPPCLALDVANAPKQLLNRRFGRRQLAPRAPAAAALRAHRRKDLCVHTRHLYRSWLDVVLSGCWVRQQCVDTATASENTGFGGTGAAGAHGSRTTGAAHTPHAALPTFCRSCPTRGSSSTREASAQRGQQRKACRRRVQRAGGRACCPATSRPPAAGSLRPRLFTRWKHAVDIARDVELGRKGVLLDLLTASVRGSARRRQQRHGGALP